MSMPAHFDDGIEVERVIPIYEHLEHLPIAFFLTEVRTRNVNIVQAKQLPILNLKYPRTGPDNVAIHSQVVARTHTAPRRSAREAVSDVCAGQARAEVIQDVRRSAL